MNGRHNLLDVGINGRKTRKWILSQKGGWVEGGERWEFVNTVSIQGRTFL